MTLPDPVEPDPGAGPAEHVAAGARLENVPGERGNMSSLPTECCAVRVMLINRPGVAGAALHTASSLIEISSRHCKSQTIRAGELKL